MLVVVLAAFLPWVWILGISVSGIRGDGVITLLMAIAGLAVLVDSAGLLAEPKIPAKIAPIVVIALGAGVVLIGLIHLNSAAAIGLYLTLFSAIAWVVGAVRQLNESKKAVPADQS